MFKRRPLVHSVAVVIAALKNFVTLLKRSNTSKLFKARLRQILNGYPLLCIPK